MPNLFSSLTECLGLSQMIKSKSFKIETALLLRSSKFPIGVDIIYKPFSNLFLAIVFFILLSCTPQSFDQKEILINENNSKMQEKILSPKKQEKIQKKRKKIINNEIVFSPEIIDQIEVLLPRDENNIITNNFVKALELSVYKKNIKEISFNLNYYSSLNELNKILEKKTTPGTIFLGPLTSEKSKHIHNFCEKDVLFFSFAFDRSLAKDCVYLINFFPEDELDALFNFFGPEKKIALIYPDNSYGNYISKIIDTAAIKSDSIIINRASYKEDLTNAREAIKELGKFELRKYELERQKKILRNKNDKISKKALKKIEKFETLGELDFTHLIIPDYNVRLLQLAPLLPFYDIDPDKIQFVGMGVWDDEAYFFEPALQGAVFPGIPRLKRKFFLEDFLNFYKEKPIRTSTIIYDFVGLISFIISEKNTVFTAKELLNRGDLSFDGIDGKFSFEKNLMKRKLNILKIFDGEAKKIN